MSDCGSFTAAKLPVDYACLSPFYQAGGSVKSGHWHIGGIYGKRSGGTFDVKLAPIGASDSLIGSMSINKTTLRAVAVSQCLLQRGAEYLEVYHSAHRLQRVAAVRQPLQLIR